MYYKDDSGIITSQFGVDWGGEEKYNKKNIEAGLLSSFNFYKDEGGLKNLTPGYNKFILGLYNTPIIVTGYLFINNNNISSISIEEIQIIEIMEKNYKRGYDKNGNPKIKILLKDGTIINVPGKYYYRFINCKPGDNMYGINLLGCTIIP